MESSGLFSRKEVSQGVCDGLTSTRAMDLEKTPMEIVSAELSHTHWVRNIKFIHSSRIPVIKLRAIAAGMNEQLMKKQSTVDVDISSTTHDHVGLRAKYYLKKQLIQWPRLRLLALFVKQLLKEHGASDAATGGLRSFALMLMLIRFYQHTYGPNLITPDSDHVNVNLLSGGGAAGKTASTRDSINTNLLGKDLLSFLSMYGTFDFSEVGISVAGAGQFLSLRESNMHNLQVCCIMWGDVNVADNASRIFSIQQIFRSSKKKLLKGDGLRSLLSLKF